MSDPVWAFLEAERSAILERLFELVSIPSVSTDPAYESGMRQAQDVLAHRLKNIGLSRVRLLDAGGHAAVYGEWLEAGDRPTILIYGHYDVQPPDPLDSWTSHPFAPEIRDHRIYGRGVSDDKGPASIALETLAAFLAVEHSLPFNAKVLLEGEEETGSPSLEGILAKHNDILEADAVLSADGARWLPGLNAVNVGSRGNAGFEFTVQTASKDLHSGRYGGVVPNALHVLAELVAALHKPDGSVAVPGFTDGAREIDNGARKALNDIPFDEMSFIANTGAVPFGEPGYSSLERLWLRPCLDVNGMWGGYIAPGGKTVIPNEAHAKLTIRVVPDQDPARVIVRVKEFLVERCPAGCSIRFGDDRGLSAAYELPDDHPLLTAVQGALSDTFGSTPYRIRIGGTLPMAHLVRRVLGVDTVMFSFSISDEDFHAPNEFFRLSSLDEGLRAWTYLFRALGQMDRDQFAPFRHT